MRRCATRSTAGEFGDRLIDEIDKIAGAKGPGPDVSREGVQRDLLPIVEGSNVSTKYGMVKTDHILSSLGALPCRKALRPDPGDAGAVSDPRRAQQPDRRRFRQVLTLPQNALIKQYAALLATEGVEVAFTEDASGRSPRCNEDERTGGEHRRPAAAHDS